MPHKADLLASGLGFPEGPVLMGDGRIVLCDGNTGELLVYQGGTVSSYARTGGSPWGAVLGSDGAVYLTQGGNVPGSGDTSAVSGIQRVLPDGSVELLFSEVAGYTLYGPNDLAFGPDGRLYFTDSGDWSPATKPHPGRIVVIETNGEAHVLEELDHVYPNGIVAEPDGSIVWVESYTLNVVRRRPDGSKRVIHIMPEGHIPDGLKIDADGSLWITAVAAGGVDVIDKSGKPLHFLDTGGTILNCVFGKGGALYCCDMGPFDVTGSAMTGRLIKVDVGVEGMPLFRGAIG
jgi:gluconolactonase